MFRSRILLPLTAFLLVVGGDAHARNCFAWFPFDGSLADASGNHHDGLLTDIENTPLDSPGEYTEGKFGQALKLDGSSVVVAPLDLYSQTCPKITIVAWIRLDGSTRALQAIYSTGFGPGPRAAATWTNLSAWGGTNEIRTPGGNAPAVGEWFPIVAVWDFRAGRHSLHWPGGDMEEDLGESSRLPAQDFWIGAYSYNATLMNLATEMSIDDVRVYGYTLDPSEIGAALRGEPPPVPGPSCDCDGPDSPTEILPDGD